MPRQVPTLSATAWILDLTEVRGPLLVVLRREGRDAVQAAIAFLVEAGVVSGATEALELIDQADLRPVGVVW
jgi:hypothetical protein